MLREDHTEEGVVEEKKRRLVRKIDESEFYNYWKFRVKIRKRGGVRS